VAVLFANCKKRKMTIDGFWELMIARTREQKIASFTVRSCHFIVGEKGATQWHMGTYLLALCVGLFRDAGQEEEVCEGEEDAVVGRAGREVVSSVEK
jgi:hypothetical protein